MQQEYLLIRFVNGTLEGVDGMANYHSMNHSRLNVRVGLDARLLKPGLALPPESIGTPSRISSCLVGDPSASFLGSGKRDSGPAIPCSTSKLDLRLIFVAVEEPNDEGGEDAILDIEVSDV